MIQVRYKDGKYDMVKHTRLDQLITSGKILEFRRSSGWVRIGRDPIRGPKSDYHGPERRRDAV